MIASRVASPFGEVTKLYIQRHTTLFGNPTTFDATLRSAMLHWLEWNSFIVKVRQQQRRLHVRGAISIHRHHYFRSTRGPHYSCTFII